MKITIEVFAGNRAVPTKADIQKNIDASVLVSEPVSFEREKALEKMLAAMVSRKSITNSAPPIQGDLS